MRIIRFLLFFIDIKEAGIKTEKSDTECILPRHNLTPSYSRLIFLTVRKTQGALDRIPYQIQDVSYTM